MQRYHKENINTPELTDKKFEKEWDFKMHTIDQARFDLLAKHYQGGMYLDIGCFNSPKPSQLAEEYPDSTIFALDHGINLINTLSERFPKVNYILGDCYELPFEDESIEYIVAGEIIEHLEDPKKMITEAMRVLKPGGRIALSTPKEETIIQHSIGGKEHMWIYNEQDMKELLEPYGEVELGEYRDGCIIMIAWCQKS